MGPKNTNSLLPGSIIALSVLQKLSLALSVLQIAALCICTPVIITLPKNFIIQSFQV